MKKLNFLFIILYIVILPSFGWSACGGSSPNLVAVSANQSDFADCVEVATYGDTITLPECAANECVWTTAGAVTITKDIKVVGKGKESTILTGGFSGEGEEGFLNFAPDSTARINISTLTSTGTIEVSGIGFYTDSKVSYKDGITIVSNNLIPVIRRIKIHHNSFTNMYKGVHTLGNISAVIYNNTFAECSYVAKPSGSGLNGFTQFPMTTGNGDGVYVEDNTITCTSGCTISTGANEASAETIRYNTVTGAMSLYVDAHSNQSSGIKGGYFSETYGNDLQATTSQSGMAIRGGKAIVYYNKVANDSDSYSWVIYEEYSDAASGTLPDGMCPSSSPQVCIDSSDSGTPCLCWKLNHSYWWGNYVYTSGNVVSPTILYDRYDNVSGHDNSPAEIVENREFWTQKTGTFDGTGITGGGVGCGTLANRPATCTTGVGYWATNQSCSDLSGMVGANPTTPISGTLYKCTATNTWEPYYTPYTYPHPLRGEFIENGGTKNGRVWFY